MKKMSILCLLTMLVACTVSPSKSEQKQEVEIVEEDELVEVSFSAVGDNLIHEAIYYYNEVNGSYMFDPIYEHTNYLTQNVDVSYINQETICAGSDLGLSGYPTFNGPYEVLDAVHTAGFTWLSGSTNHAMDRGEEGILNEVAYLKKYPDMTVTGIHASLEDAKKVQVMEVNGLKIGVNSYTYGLNGFTLPEGKEYLVNLIDKEQIKQDVEALKKVSDVQIISMHWGEEYQFVENEEQRELAQYLSDLGVDVIIGSHPHVIQPMDVLKGFDGNETLVMYSLGNFLSAQDENYRMLGGMARWKIVYNKSKDEVQFENVEFWPTVTYISDSFKNYRTYVLKDYTDELANNHTLHVNYQQDVSRQYYIDLVNSIMNDKIKIVY